MRKGVVRLTVLALLLFVGGGTAFLVDSASQQLAAIDAGGHTVSQRIDRLLVTVSDVAAAQHAYVAPGQPPQQAFEQVAARVQQIYSETAAMRPSLQSTEA